MARPVEHDIASSVTTTGWETAKVGIEGGILGALSGALIGAVSLVGGSIAAVLPALAIAGAGVVIGGAIAMASPTIGLGAGVGYGILGMFGLTAAVGAISGAITGATYGAVGGGVLGLFKGGSRVSREKQAYQDKVAGRGPDAVAAKIVEAQNIGLQQGYEAGFQQGAQHVANEIQKMQYAAIQAEMAKNKATGSFVAKEEQKRAAAATTTPQVGA